MSQRTVSDREKAAERRFNQLKVQRFTSDIHKATGHSLGRNSRVVEVLSYFSLMGTSKPDLVHAKVGIEAAVRQLFRSPQRAPKTFEAEALGLRDAPHQAAHYLPGQILIATALPWTFISDRLTSRNLENLFGDVEHLPADFNKADSAAEHQGLVETFREACEAVLRDPLAGAANRINRDRVRTVYDEVWVTGANRAFDFAIAQKELKPQVPEPHYDENRDIDNFDEISAAPESAFHVGEQIRILRRYAETLRQAPNDLGDARLSSLEQSFKP